MTAIEVPLSWRYNSGMLDRLIDHLMWADGRTAEALASLPEAEPELVKLYAHLLGAESVWLTRIAGQPLAVPPWPALDLAGCAALSARNHAAIRAILSTINNTSLARRIRYTNTAGDAFTNTVDEILHHVVMHGMYHRGQIMRGVRQGGGTPLATDFIAFVRGR